MVKFAKSKIRQKDRPPNCPKKQKWHLVDSTICSKFAAVSVRRYTERNNGDAKPRRSIGEPAQPHMVRGSSFFYHPKSTNCGRE